MSPRHYLDHASTSPLRPTAACAITAYAAEALHADPGRPYSEGRDASAVIERARSEVAHFLSVGEREVIFTSSGTEAANFATFATRARDATSPIVCSGVEHAAVRLSAERSGPVRALAVDRLGRVDLDDLEKALRERPALVNCQLANHEVATLQPVAAAVAMCKQAEIPIHVDACAAIGQMPVDLGALGADFVSLSAHKFGGPPGVGVLVLARRRRAQAMLVGGDQERARRAGYENALGIVGLGAAAAELTQAGVLHEADALARQRTEIVMANALEIDGVSVFGDPVERVSHMVCLGVAGVQAEGVVLGLDQAGIAVHSGSACSSEAFEPSPVLQAMGVDAEHSLRVSVGWSSTEDDLRAFCDQFGRVVAALRALA